MWNILLFALLLACDLAVKHWAVSVLAEVGTIPIINGIFALTYAENKGAAFSMLWGARWFFVAVAAVFSVVIVIYIKKGFFTKWWSRVGMIFLLAGTVGNAIDRVRYGYVVDMFELKFINFAIFNVADLFITVGAIVFAVYLLFFEGREKLKEAQTGETENTEETVSVGESDDI